MSDDLCHIDRPRTAGLHQFSNSSITEESQDEFRLIDIDIDSNLSLFYYEEHRIRQSLKRSREKKITGIIIIKNLIFWPLKLTAKRVKICLNFINSRVGVVKIVAEDRILNFVYPSENSLEKKGKILHINLPSNKQIAHEQKRDISFPVKNTIRLPKFAKYIYHKMTAIFSNQPTSFSDFASKM